MQQLGQDKALVRLVMRGLLVLIQGTGYQSLEPLVARMAVHFFAPSNDYHVFIGDI